ncbi:threonine dehydrogenase-like Zn-dependent dehydrogenase [Gordonia amarae]|nr:alcohol dehydrogenase catalytic domain-containing protein [Gordonia amarae]MCS3876570.1 threonine dehydrogenase-like Zn-dependent dehydrogenase [Gordonia amarae]GAB04498.1 putative zinc-containing alcohol dehydrogenase [Gordonia amarae NBRC 15530]
MTTMKAMSLKEGTLAIREVARPAPGSGQILVRTLACAICASDHHYMDHPEVVRADRSRMQIHAPHDDVVMGHEYCGEIVEYGPDTARAWPVGTRITATPALFTPDGLRIIGMAPDAPGGFGEYFLVSEGFARPVPESVPPENLALIDAMAVGWYYTRIGVADENAVPLVIGLGAIGLSVVIALKQRGVPHVVVADFSADRRALAQRLGADVAVDSAVEQPFTAWRRTAWGTEEDVVDRVRLFGLSTCAVYECVGREGILADIIEQCPIGTRVFSAGGAASDTIPSNTAHLKGINLQFGGGPDPADWFEMCDLVTDGTVDTGPLVGEIVGFDGLVDAFERARSSTAPPRIVFRPDRR